MCIRVTEIYAVCRCVYYVHGVDQCGSFGSPGHYVEDRSVLVGHTCPSHASSYANTSSHGHYSSSSQRAPILPEYGSSNSSYGSYDPSHSIEYGYGSHR
ncbi:hypothetical protein FPQ18DRAFT_250558 [Pyronema domesticum]|uniref:Uncharacterized protein n=1 Tax=Pyronema omphalodes (strain CBS 100304) TaxID=1076935 RepID=U4LVU5_PYROM|nr:hypothetical protein FPQ18DRAFT_250558 [Pyronema domesticum]CCX34882.1 Similar to hypothetical protein [Tuber melanosporum Mel28]; acc. no. XP_002839259 [Pyronema omphalodes CBS 100304]